MRSFIRKAVAFALTFSMTIAPLFVALFQGGKQAFFEDWSANEKYDASYAVQLEKARDKDFVILNLADIQMNDGETFGEAGEQTFAIIDKLVNDTAPDLITLSGDNAIGYLSYNTLIRKIDAYGIPWAPVMGNHDGQGCPSEFWCAYNFAKAENCLFRFGPKDMGYGNYILNIVQDGSVIHSLFMMDTHESITEDNINGSKEDEGYDHLWTNQMEWYKWAVDGIRQQEGHVVESTVIFHIPLVEYNRAWDEATDENGNYKEDYTQSCFGVKHEGVCCALQNNGFFNLLLETGSTKNVLCGHDHINSFSIPLEGIRLSYGLKCGSGCYWEKEMNGGTTLTISADGGAAVAHHYVDVDKL